MNSFAVKKIYLIGICGTAMASLAGLLKSAGYDVMGSDANVYPPMSDQLREIGVSLYDGYSPANLRSAMPDLVIPGNAIPRGNPELEEMLNSGLRYASMAEAVKEFFLRDTHSVVVAGTHGKTTTTSLCAWVLDACGISPSYLVGGIPLNFGRSYRWQPESKYFVIEGDEYDTGFMDRRPKFVQYLPETVILNAVEFDHADIYADLAAVENAFWQLIKIVPSNGTIIVNRDSDTAYTLATRGYSRVVTFGYHAQSDFRIDGETWRDGVATFRLNDSEFQIPVFGRHNIANAAAAIVLARNLGIPEEQILGALRAFEGVKRRMESRGDVNGITVYDDFAHHPTAIQTTLEGARLAFPQSRIWAIFEPRSWSSRRNIFQSDFARAFTSSDFAIIGAVFEPDKLPEDVRLDPEKLVSEITSRGVRAHYMPDYEKLCRCVTEKANPGDKVIVMSNGSFDNLHERLLASLREKHSRNDYAAKEKQ